MKGIGSWFRGRRTEKDLESEMKFHLDMEIEAGRRRGLSDEEARRQAVLHAGTIPRAMEETRDEQPFAWLTGILTDLRHSWVGLLRQPGFLAISVAVLTLAVAANTLIFTIVNGVLLKPLPYRDPERLVRIFEWSERYPKFPVSILNYQEDKRESQTLESIGLYTGADMELMHGETPERLSGVRVTHDFFSTLGVQPMIGRNFQESELKNSTRLVILGHTMWRTRFQSDPNVVGKTIRLNRDNWTVIGVMPEGFQHTGGTYRSPLQGETVDLWLPLGIDLRESGLRFWHFTNAVARLKPGVTMEVASQDLNRIMDELTKRFPDAYGKKRARIEPLNAEVVGKSAWTVQLILAAGLIVLVVACINIAGLCVARVIARQPELAIRQALGGGRWRLIRAVLSENLVLGAIGGVAGLSLAALSIPLFRAVLPADFPRLHEIRMDATASAFAVMAALATSLLAGLIPAFRHTSQLSGTATSTRVTTPGHGLRSFRGLLVVAEVALACVLCFGAALLVRSGQQLASRDHGFQSAGVVTFQLNFPGKVYDSPAPVVNFLGEAIRKWKEIPGVAAVGAGSAAPWTGYDDNAGFSITGRPAKPGEAIQARFHRATPGFFEALCVPLRRGRLFQENDNGIGDAANGKLVAIVNEALVNRYFDGADPIGREIDFFGRKRRIVGVVADIRDYPADLEAEPAVWMSALQEPAGGMTIVARASSGDGSALLPHLRNAMASVDRELPMAEVRSVEKVAEAALAERRFALLVCEGFAGLGLLLAAIGIYGLLTYIVQQRRKEIGIRMALGATRPALLWMVTGSGMRLALVGVLGGLLMAPLAGRAMAALLYGVSSTDRTTLVIAPLAMLAAALAASSVPGWIAARSHPMSVLRDQ
jgi:macrolide transport system ATP-binding/permease protein